MALMFSRIARNFIKNGYFPTDEDTISRILSALEVNTEHPIAIIDPCCGEGTALAEVAHHLTSQEASVTSYGIEYDEERAYHAKSILDQCIHADINDCGGGLRSFSLLWLNPPYGFLMGDSERSSSSGKRLEKEFAKRCFPMLQPGGIAIFIVPYSVLDKELSTIISRNLTNVTVHAAPEQQFKQVVVMGIKRARVGQPDKEIVNLLCQVQKNIYLHDGLWLEGFLSERVLPKRWSAKPYVVPAKNSTEMNLYTVHVDAKQLASEISKTPLMWKQFKTLFRSHTSSTRPPLRKLSDWHLALMLAAGQIAGVVTGQSGRVFLVKGDTHKTKSVRNETKVDPQSGSATLTRIETDRFVPMIRALDFTEGSEQYGRVFRIQ